jgi:MFS transporter, FSR family, fosmidomycin resistance protein
MNLPRKTVFWAVAFGHLTMDAFNGIGPVLLAYLSVHALPMTDIQIGFAASVYSMAGSFAQPLFGWLADKNGGRWQGAGGLAWTVILLMVSLGLAVTTGQYTLMVVPFILGAFGSAAFHPTGALHAAEAEQERAGKNLSLFFLMGYLGLGIGPALLGFLLDRVSIYENALASALGPKEIVPAATGQLMAGGTLTPVFALAALAIPAVLLMARFIPRRHIPHLPAPARTSSRPTEGRGEKERADGVSVSVSQLQLATTHKQQIPVRALLFLALVVTLRSLANPGAVTFIPRLFQAKGWDASQYGLITSSFWIAAGIAGVIFGQIADRVGSRNIITLSLLLSVPTLFFLPALDGLAAYAMAMAAGALTGGSHTLIVLQAQRLMPARKGLASGATMGFIFGTGAIGSLIVGGLSDRLGLASAFEVVAGVTLVAAVLGLLLPPDRKPVADPTLTMEIETARLETMAEGVD